MAEAYPSDEDVPKTWNHKSALAFRNFVAGNPQLVEVQGLEGKDGKLLTAELLLLLFESAKQSGGGELLKIYVSKKDKVAMLRFKDIEDAKRVLNGRYMVFNNDYCLTVGLPSAHIWKVESSAVLVQEVETSYFNSLQDMENFLRSWFMSCKYESDVLPTVLEILISPENGEALVIFEDFIDALHVMTEGEDGIKMNDEVVGHLMGPFRAPENLKKSLRQAVHLDRSSKENSPSIDSPDDKITMHVKQDRLQKDITLDQLQGTIRELGFEIKVSCKTHKKAFVLEGPKDQIGLLVESVKKTAQSNKESDDQDTKSKGTSPSSVYRDQPVEMRKSVQETQPPHPVAPTDFLGEHSLAEKELAKRQSITSGMCASPGPGNSETPPAYEEFLPNGTALLIYTGNITQVKVDVVVNAANGRMRHGGGVAEAIAIAAGPELEMEGFRIIREKGKVMVTNNIVTTGGRLCKFVIHAVGPHARGYGLENCQGLLATTIIKALDTFGKLKDMESIAIPAISSGVYGVPINMVARAFKEAISLYDNSMADRTSPKKIHLVNILPVTTKSLIDVFWGEQQTVTKSADQESNQRGEGLTLRPGENSDLVESIGTFPARQRREQRAEAPQDDNQDNKESGGFGGQDGSFFDRSRQSSESFMVGNDAQANVAAGAQRSDNNENGRGFGRQDGSFFDCSRQSNESFMVGNDAQANIAAGPQQSDNNRESKGFGGQDGSFFDRSRRSNESFMLGNDAQANVAAGAQQSDNSGRNDNHQGGFFDRVQQSNEALFSSGNQPSTFNSNGGQFDGTTMGAQHGVGGGSSFGKDRDSPPYSSFTRDVHSPGSLERLRQRQSVGQQLSPDGQRSMEVGNQNMRENLASVSADVAVGGSYVYVQREGTQKLETMQKIKNDYEEWQKYLLEQWMMKPVKDCTNTEQKQRYSAMELLTDITERINQGDAEGARNGLIALGKLPKESAKTSMTSKETQEKSASASSRSTFQEECLQQLRADYRELQKVFVLQWSNKQKENCTEEDTRVHSRALELLNKVSDCIIDGNVKEAEIRLAEVKKCAGQLMSATTGRRQTEFACSSSPFRSPDGSSSRNQTEPVEPMEVDDDNGQGQLSKSSSSNSSYEVINEGNMDGDKGMEPSQYISEDEEQSLPLPGTLYSGDEKGKGAAASSVDARDEECPICLEKFTEKKKLEKCGHEFCKACIEKAFLDCGPKCPLCGTMYGKMQGTQPQNGQMTVSKQKASLPGYGAYDSIVIHYHFPSGIQEANHPNPGRPYSGTSRTAYLPDNPNGRRVMKLLRQAFEARLVFTIGQSVTTGKTDTVVWNNIHHKTSMHGGSQQYGYPDPTYLTRVLQELAAFGIK